MEPLFATSFSIRQNSRENNEYRRFDFRPTFRKILVDNFLCDFEDLMRYSATVMLILLVAASARADIIHLKNGGEREGRIVKQDDDVVVLEISSGSATATIRIRRGDIERIEKKLTPQQAATAEYRKRLGKLDRSDTDAVIELAKWCAEKKMFDKAEGLLNTFASRGETEFDRAYLALAEIEHKRRRFNRAVELVEEVLKKHPKNVNALAMQKELKDERRRYMGRLLSEAVKNFNAGKFDQALKKINSFHTRATPEQSRTLLAKMKFPEGMDFGQFIGAARLRRRCSACEDGYKVCKIFLKKTSDVARARCKVCGGLGSTICKKCSGTQVRFGEVPLWQLPAFARAVEKAMFEDLAAFDASRGKLVATLEGKRRTVLQWFVRAELRGSRVIRWLKELQKYTRGKPASSTVDAADKLKTMERQLLELYQQAGDYFGDSASATWDEVEGSGKSRLAQDKTLREARIDAIYSLNFFARTRRTKRSRYPAGVGLSVGKIKPILAKLDKAVKHNERLTKIYEAAFKYIGNEKMRKALECLVALVENASKLNLEFLSKKTEQNHRMKLTDTMAAVRFEAGKEKGNFGKTTDYERGAFVKKLLAEADGMANLAHADYQTMDSMRDRGRRAEVPTTLVNRTLREARDAQRWYQALLRVRYPLSIRTRNKVDKQIEYMKEIISDCRRWFTRRLQPVGGN